MSSIDVYRHNHLGFIECPSTYNFVAHNNTRHVAIYELLENIPSDEGDFDGNMGDLLIGGGSGEAPAFRISIPLAFKFFTVDDDAFCDLEFDSLGDLFKTFWTPTESYIFCEGYAKLGWTVETSIELWLAENVCKLLISTVDKYSIYKTGNLDLITNLTFEKTS